MAVACVHNLGLELPVYGSETRVVTLDTIKTVNRHEGDYFIRYARLLPNTGVSLKQTLKVADSIFKLAAEQTGGMVVDHNWGLYDTGLAEIPSFAYHQLNPRMDKSCLPLPIGHALVAEVAVLDEVQSVTREEAWTIHEALSFTRHQNRALTWTDANSNQFVHGVNRSDKMAGLWLVDIEPLIH